MILRITEIRVGDKLRSDLYTSGGLHVLGPGATLTETNISNLYRHQIEYVDIEPRHRRTEDELGLDELELNRRACAEAVQSMKQLFHQACITGKLVEADVDQGYNLLASRMRAEHNIMNLLNALENKDDYTYEHCVQVGILSYYIARWLGCPDDVAYEAGKSGFLHDIGKCRIPSYILQKPSRLTTQEYAVIKKHTFYGQEIISASGLMEVYALSALQHHERINGMGYPLAVKGPDIHPTAKIVAVADIYSAMISSRTYQLKRDFLDVLKEIFSLSYHELDPAVAQTFIRHMIPNFLGKRVLLSSGEFGEVIFNHPVEFFSPLVRVKDKYIDLSRHSDITIDKLFA